ncbi:2-iminoacetate synthase ThiH [Proteinivorax hydrogeniformans]|uniref:2-iminoacetate synthase ThiH n=1 Tax=Proteinivorax hydrogeniformans TaxID=1826727 RepID=A0AAU8HVD8_9FIRM
MSFTDIIQNYSDFDYSSYFSSIKKDDILKVLNKSKLDINDYLALLSPAASECLEEMAQRANRLSIQHFGKTVLLYTPMYLSNYCVNKCLYCSFNAEHNIKRKKLDECEIEKEAISISKTGIKHILLLTGESRQATPVSYILSAVKILKKYFQSISIEIYPLTGEEYRQMVDAGVDGLTIYQEVYDEDIYKKVHVKGPKKDYHFRLKAPERACEQKIRTVNIGALLGLSNWRQEAFITGLHASYLQGAYPDVEVSISLPRIRPHVGRFDDIYPVGDRELVQILLAFKNFIPFGGVTISTREEQAFRDKLVPLGVTKMSAGVMTSVGGHSTKNEETSQFEIGDTRSVEEMKKAIFDIGYQPIFKDWLTL